MPAGTITLTNNSATATGNGTAFATELKANDFLVAVVGGVTYTLGVKSVESATSLTLIAAYGGPTSSGLAWTAVPNAALVGITAQVAADVAKAIRGLNLDKANWQQIFTETGNVTVTLPDGTTWTGPAWNGITTTLAGKAAKGANGDITSLTGLTTALSIEQGGTGAKTAATAIAALGGLPLAGGTMAAAISFASTAIARATANNLGITYSGGVIRIPYGSGYLQIIATMVAVTLDANGAVTISFPQAFTSLLSVVAISGNYNVDSGRGNVSTQGPSATGFNGRVMKDDGSAITGSYQFNYVAIGIV